MLLSLKVVSLNSQNITTFKFIPGIVCSKTKFVVFLSHNTTQNSLK